MGYPAGVSVAVINAGSAGTFFGDDATISARVTPVLAGTKRIVHAATGAVLIPAPMTFTASEGGVLSFQVPHVDQPGWLDGSGKAYTMWAYRAEVTVTHKAGRVTSTQKWSQAFQPLVGQDLIDLDFVTDGEVGEPVSAPYPDVTSVNGMTGAVIVTSPTITEIEPGVYVFEEPQ